MGMSRLVSVVGTPSPRLYATMNIIRALTQILLGDHQIVVANSIPALREQFKADAAPKGRSVVLFSDYPNSEILAALCELKAPVVICLDDFTTIAHFAVISREFGAVEAARFAMMGLVKLEAVLLSPPSRSLVIRESDMSLSTLIGKLAALYRLPLDDASLEKILAFIGVSDQREMTLGQYVSKTQPNLGEARDRLERRSPLENELIDFLAPSYDQIARGRPLNELEWPVYALLRPEFPDRLTVGPIDLTGPARHIYYGPYFALSAGLWSADISLEVQDCLSDNQLAIDAFSEQMLAIIKMKLPARGVYGCQIEFEIVDPSKPVEIRMQLLTGAIEGFIQVRGIRLQRIASSDEAD